MSRRVLIIVIVLILAVSIIIGFVLIRKKTVYSGNPFKVIPVTTSLILKVNNFHNLSRSLTKENKIWRSLGTLEAFSEVTKKISYIDSIACKNILMNEVLLNSIIYISAYTIDQRKSEFLFVVNLKSPKSENSIIELLIKCIDQNFKKNIQKYEGKSIYTIKVSENEIETEVYLTLLDGNIIISRSEILIENSIRQFGLSKSLSDDPEFVKVFSTAGKNKDANLFIDLRRIMNFSSVFASDSFKNELTKYKNFGAWAGFDINSTEDQIIFNGFISAGTDENTLLNIFGNSHPVAITVDKILPVSTSTFLSFGLGNLETSGKGLNRYLTGIGKSTRHKKELKKLDEIFDFDAEKLFLSIIDNEITIAQCSTNDTVERQSSFVLAKCKSVNLAKKELYDLLVKACKKKGINIEKQQYTYIFDSDTKFDIFVLPISNLTGSVFGSLFNMGSNCYYTFYGNYLIIGESFEALSSLLHNNVLNKTLNNSEVYKGFRNNLAQQSYILFYADLSRAPFVFAPFIENNICKSWKANTQVFDQLQPFGMQITDVSNTLYCNILAQYIGELKVKPQTVWETLLDTSFSFKPQFVLNHNNKQNEIFIQDLGNKIYLINKAGRIIWKQKIAEQINSKVYQVDYFKNGKLQILFSTLNYIHLIDRNGNYVERYPVRLRAPASEGLSLFDYDNDKSYRILIPCTDNKIYAYGIEGSLITGWQFKGSDYPVDQPISHFKIGDKDYIVFGDKFHTYILDRKGVTRVPVDVLIAKSKNNEYLLDNSSTPDKARILITDTTGTIVSIYFDGHIATTSAGTFSANHIFDFKDVDGDGINDYIFLDKNTLTIFKQDNSKIFSYDFPNTMNEKPLYFRFSATDRKLGFVDKTDQKIYLINNDGSIYKGFPLIGTTLFSIGYLDAKEGAFNLIVGGRNNFLYNYSVQ